MESSYKVPVDPANNAVSDLGKQVNGLPETEGWTDDPWFKQLGWYLVGAETLALWRRVSSFILIDRC